MNQEPLILARLDSADDELRHAERFLLAGSAAAVWSAASHMELALAHCAGFQTSLAALDAEARAHARDRVISVRARLVRVAGLIEAAADFHSGWMRIAAARAAAYGPDGSELGLPESSAVGSRVDASL